MNVSVSNTGSSRIQYHLKRARVKTATWQRYRSKDQLKQELQQGTKR
jgi:hypothetical protein